MMKTSQCPRMGELKFKGLLIEEGWNFHSRHVILPAGSTVLLLVVVGARSLFGDWDTVFAAGAFFVALIALSVQWLHYAVNG
jgi:hypothetical protein